MPAERRSRKSMPDLEDESVIHKDFDIPYFAHQVLDPKKFSYAVGLPVGGPPRDGELNNHNDRTTNWNEDEGNDDNNGDASSDEQTYGVADSGKKRRRSNAQGQEEGNTFKRMKITGGRPPMAKKITADMDSEDEIIFSMKNAKYLEKDIAKRLADEGRTQYNPKTIGTRWARLKMAMREKQDELLDADLTDWHEGDDDALYQAIAKADAAVEKAKREVESRKWRIVADHIKNEKPVTNFSQNACQRRYEALQNGTAKPTPESILNPDETILARIRSRCEKQAKLEADQSSNVNFEQSNLEGNGWTSKMRKDL